MDAKQVLCCLGYTSGLQVEEQETGLGVNTFTPQRNQTGLGVNIFTPQKNQLQELPYNELSRLSGLRTLDLHSNLISSEGEGLKLGTTRSQPLSTSAVLPVVASSWGFPQLLSAVEFQGLGDGGGCGF